MILDLVTHKNGEIWNLKSINIDNCDVNGRYCISIDRELESVIRQEAKEKYKRLKAMGNLIEERR
jgi:hypothetical protein